MGNYQSNVMHMINSSLSDDAIRIELGSRAQAYRLRLNQDQETFAYEAGVSVSTLYRLEKGGPVSFDAYIKVLRVLGLLDRLDSLIPALDISPIQRASRAKGKERQRATGKRKTGDKNTEWKGFEQQVDFEAEGENKDEG